MDTSEAIVVGILHPDGKLELCQIPNVSPDPVCVIVQPTGGGTQGRRTLAEMIEEIERDQQARGFSGRAADEFEAGIREGEDARLS